MGSGCWFRQRLRPTRNRRNEVGVVGPFGTSSSCLGVHRVLVQFTSNSNAIPFAGARSNSNAGFFAGG